MTQEDGKNTVLQGALTRQFTLGYLGGRPAMNTALFRIIYIVQADSKTKINTKDIYAFV